jgi:hypothetical protein
VCQALTIGGLWRNTIAWIIHVAGIIFPYMMIV